jgi:hypothetical protein
MASPATSSNNVEKSGILHAAAQVHGGGGPQKYYYKQVKCLNT